MQKRISFKTIVARYIKPSCSKILSTVEKNKKLVQISKEKPKWNRYTFLKEYSKIICCFSI